VQAADIAITDAQIERGKLRITGTTRAGGVRVRLDGRKAPAFTVTSNATSKAFAFDLACLPGDCIVSVELNTS
jgi:hypothetical protein